MKVLVAGGGVVATAIALELAGDAHQVTVVAPPDFAPSASGRLAPQLEALGPGPLLDLCLLSRAQYPAWVAALSSASGVAVGYRESGALQLAFTTGAAYALEATVAWQRAAGLRAELLCAEETRQREPATSPRALAAAFFPDDHQCDPLQLGHALTLAATRAGVSFRSGTVCSVEQKNGRVTGVTLTPGEHGPRAPSGLAEPATLAPLTPGFPPAPPASDGPRPNPTDPIWAKGVLFVPGRIEGPASNEDPGATTPGGAWPSRLDADRVILATTRWEHLLTGLPDARPPGPPALQLRLELPAPPFRALIQGETCSLESQADGRVIVRGLVPTTAQALLADAVALVPALAGARLSATLADLPVETGNAQPSLGEASLAGLILAAGHFTHEVLLAPITARLVGQLLRGMKTIVPLRPFRSSSLRP